MNRAMFFSFVGATLLTCGAGHGAGRHEPPCGDGAQEEHCRTFLGSNGTSFLQAKSVLGRTGLMESSDSVETPSEVMACPAAAVSTTVSMTQAKYHAVAESVTELLLNLSSRCTASECPRADWAGCVLRLAGHDFMDYNNGVGGSDACTDMNHIDNTGLAPCLHEGEHGVSLSDAYVQHCADVSLADFIVIAAEAIMEASRSPGSGRLNFHATFRYGRTTISHCPGAAELLPNPSRGCPAVEETFVNRMGLSWRSAAALMGVHSLGRAKIENSGFHGWWSDPINSRLFNNNYFVSLVSKGWVPETSVGGRTVKSQWGRSDAQRDSSFDGHEMMLDTDLCLAFAEGPNRRELTPVLSSIHDCCAWVNFAVGGTRCGNRRQCCGQNADDCGRPGNPSGPAAAHVLEFGNNEQAWIQEFKTAWTRATENGAQGLKSLEPDTPAPSPSPVPPNITPAPQTSTPSTPTIAPAPTPVPASTPEPTRPGRKGRKDGRGRKRRRL